MAANKESRQEGPVEEIKNLPVSQAPNEEAHANRAGNTDNEDALPEVDDFVAAEYTWFPPLSVIIAIVVSTFDGFVCLTCMHTILYNDIHPALKWLFGFTTLGIPWTISGTCNIGMSYFQHLIFLGKPNIYDTDAKEAIWKNAYIMNAIWFAVTAVMSSFPPYLGYVPVLLMGIESYSGWSRKKIGKMFDLSRDVYKAGEKVETSHTAITLLGCGAAVAYGRLATIMPTLAGFLLPMIIALGESACLFVLDSFMMLRPRGYNPMCLSYQAYNIQMIAEAARLASIVAAVLQGMPLENWVFSMACGLVQNVFIRMGYVSKILRIVSGGKYGHPSSVQLITYKLKFISCYPRLSFIPGFMMLRLAIGSPAPWYISMNSIQLIIGLLVFMLAEDALVWLFYYKLAWNPRPSQTYYTGASDLNKKSYRFTENGGYEENLTQVPSRYDRILIWMTCVMHGPFLMIVAITGSLVSFSCLTGFSDECTGNAFDAMILAQHPEYVLNM